MKKVIIIICLFTAFRVNPRITLSSSEDLTWGTNIKTGATAKAVAPVFYFGCTGDSHPGGESGKTRVSAKTSIMKIFAIRFNILPRRKYLFACSQSPVFSVERNEIHAPRKRKPV
jgi:hypothetical protein